MRLAGPNLGGLPVFQKRMSNLRILDMIGFRDRLLLDAWATAYRLEMERFVSTQSRLSSSGLLRAGGHPLRCRSRFSPARRIDTQYLIDTMEVRSLSLRPRWAFSSCTARKRCRMGAYLGEPWRSAWAAGGGSFSRLRPWSPGQREMAVAMMGNLLVFLGVS